MEFEVSIRVRVDPSAFYWDASVTDRLEAVTELIRNAMYDLDDVKINSMEVEELE